LRSRDLIPASAQVSTGGLQRLVEAKNLNIENIAQPIMAAAQMIGMAITKGNNIGLSTKQMMMISARPWKVSGFISGNRQLRRRLSRRV